MTGRIETNGVSLAYELVGPESGEVVLAITGVIDTLLHWHPGLCWRLADAGYRTLRYDSRDCGQSTWFDHAPAGDSPYMLSDLAKDAVGLLDVLGISRAHVVGFSMGGCVGQVMAIEHPARVSSLVPLMSTSRAPELPPRHPDVARQGITRTAPIRSRAETVERLVAMLAVSDGSRYARTKDEKLNWADQLIVRGYNPPGVERHVLALGASPSYLDRLGSIRAPTTVIHADEDKYFSRAHGEDLARRIPGARLEIIEGAGHAISNDLVPRLAELLIGHLAWTKNRA